MIQVQSSPALDVRQVTQEAVTGRGDKMPLANNGNSLPIIRRFRRINL